MRLRAHQFVASHSSVVYLPFALPPSHWSDGAASGHRSHAGGRHMAVTLSLCLIHTAGFA